MKWKMGWLALAAVVVLAGLLIGSRQNILGKTA